MDQKAIGSYIRTLRKERCLTQKELAEALSVSFQAVSKWEIGETLPDTGILLELCDILDTSADKLLNGGSYIRKEQKRIPMERIVEGFGHIEKARDCFGAQSEFYRGMTKGIRDMMNFDFEDALCSRKEVLYTEAILHFLEEGYRVDMEDVRMYIHEACLIDEIAKRL